MRKLTTQEFIDRARAIHGDKYGYAFSVYQDSKTKLTVYCQEHGLFKQKPNSHLNGNGCPGCFGKKKHTNESFISSAIKVHGETTYDYSMVEYLSAHQKVVIVCPTHGTFKQKPNQHLNGNGCPVCADTKHTTESFIQKAREVHGENSYNYSLVEYVSNRIKVVVQCEEHGEFEQTPANHLQGQGCPGCAKYGFDRTKPASLYVLRSDCGRYMKIGITHNPKQRYNKLKRDTPFSFKRIELIKGPGEQVADLEKELLAKYEPAGFTETFDGFTEWRLWSDSVLTQFRQHRKISVDLYVRLTYS